VRAGDVLLVAAFLSAIALPLIDRLFGIDPAPPLVEKRQLAPLPGPPHDWATLRDFPGDFERYWNDAFGFRRMLVRSYNRMLVACGTSPLPEKVTVGRDDWLYFAAERALDDYEGERPFSEAELLRWQYLLEARRDWLADRGIPYVFYVAPNKETIYPEYMPRRIRRGSVHRFDQLLDHLARYSDFDVVDERPLLTRAKADGRMYRQTDSHWTDRGALLVVADVVRRADARFPALEVLAPEALNVNTDAGAGDLVEMLGLSGLLHESWEHVAPRAPRAKQTSATDVSTWTEVDDASLPSAVFFHDSFGRLQIPFFAEHFRKFRSVWTKEMDPSVVEAEHPDLVIQEFSERFLSGPFPRDSSRTIDNTRLRSRFETSARILVGGADGARGITPATGMQVSASDPGVVATAEGDESAALLPQFEMPRGFVAVVRIELDSPVAARLELWYATHAEPTYDQPRSVWWPLAAGSNTAWLLLTDPDLDGRVRLDLTAPGAYHVRSLEVRAVAASGVARGEGIASHSVPW
jgi:hypothetical protein